MPMQPPLVRCPEFLPGFTWFNTGRPLSVAEDLRGRVSVLDFCTYCCINCMHVLPVLRRIEERFAHQPVVVIGVHSAKVISERDPQNIRRAVQRHGIVHPVVVDSDHDIWERFGVRAWPTLVLLDAAGYVRETMSDKADEKTLTAKIEALLEEGIGNSIPPGDQPIARAIQGGLPGTARQARVPRTSSPIGPLIHRELVDLTPAPTPLSTCMLLWERLPVRVAVPIRVRILVEHIYVGRNRSLDGRDSGLKGGLHLRVTI